MTTREVASEYRLAHWAGIVKERQESGLSIRAFCENAGFHENTYHYWQKKLREAACGALAGIQAGTAISAAHPGFTEVRLSERPALPPPTAVWQNQISVEVADIRITAGSEYPESKLAALLREVMRPC